MAQQTEPALHPVAGVRIGLAMAAIRIMETLAHARIEAALPAVLAYCQTATQYPLHNAFGAKH